MACHFHRTYVGRVILRPDVIVLQDPGGVEDIDKWLARCIQCPGCVGHTIVHRRAVEIGGAVEIVVGVLNLLHHSLGGIASV